MCVCESAFVRMRACIRKCNQVCACVRVCMCVCTSPCPGACAIWQMSSCVCFCAPLCVWAPVCPLPRPLSAVRAVSPAVPRLHLALPPLQSRRAPGLRQGVAQGAHTVRHGLRLPLSQAVNGRGKEACNLICIDSG